MTVCSAEIYYGLVGTNHKPDGIAYAALGLPTG